MNYVMEVNKMLENGFLGEKQEEEEEEETAN